MNTHNSFKSNYKFFLHFLSFLLSIKVVFSDLFIDIKKLSSFNKYFVVLDTGLYLYNFYDMDCALVYQFSKNKTVNDRIILDSLSDGKNHYILCLVNKFLFIFNENNNRTITKILNEIYTYKPDDYCNLLPYKIENNNISFITVFNNGTDQLVFYYYNVSLTEQKNTTKIIKFDIKDIKNKMIKCKIIANLSIIKCFFYKKQNGENFLSHVIYNIKNMNISGNNPFDYTVSSNIKQIKMALSHNNKFFICYLLDSTPICQINDYSSNDLKDISCSFNSGSYTNKYKVLYFNETDEFIFIDRSFLETTRINNFYDSVKL